MRGLFCIMFLGTLTPKSCQHAPAPPPSDVASAPALKTASNQQQSKASAAVAGATKATEQAPDSPAKTAASGELKVAAANLPTPSAADLAESLARVNAALTGQLKTAQDAWATAEADGAARSVRITMLERQVETERKDAAIELQRQLQQAHDEERTKAAADQRRMIGWIFYGGSFLLGVGAAVVLGTASYIPLFGPKLAISLGIAAAGSALAGVLINELLANPWIIRVLLGIIVAAIAGAIGLAVSNHHHATTTTPATP